jgi:cobalt-zinc-cadmium efflux system protein
MFSSENGMASGHPHHHGDHHGAHGHAAVSHGRAFAIGIALNLGIVVTELAYGFASHSMALIADAAHNASDVLGLGIAWAATVLMKRKPSKRHTYGLRRISILAALANAVLLLVGTGGVGWEAIRRLEEPGAVDGRTVMFVAGAAVVVNGASALLFMHDRRRDLNIRSAFLHLSGDAAIALGVVVSGWIILMTGWSWVDPLVSLFVSALVLLSTWSLLRRSFNLALDAVPDGIDPEAVRTFLSKLPGVTEVHDLHIWAMSTTENALTAHLVMPGDAYGPAFLGEVCKSLHDVFHIEHSTLQVEPENAPSPCRLAPEETV